MAGGYIRRAQAAEWTTFCLNCFNIGLVPLHFIWLTWYCLPLRANLALLLLSEHIALYNGNGRLFKCPKQIFCALSFSCSISFSPALKCLIQLQTKGMPHAPTVSMFFLSLSTHWMWMCEIIALHMLNSLFLNSPCLHQRIYLFSTRSLSGIHSGSINYILLWTNDTFLDEANPASWKRTLHVSTHSLWTSTLAFDSGGLVCVWILTGVRWASALAGRTGTWLSKLRPSPVLPAAWWSHGLAVFCIHTDPTSLSKCEIFRQRSEIFN